MLFRQVYRTIKFLSIRQSGARSFPRLRLSSRFAKKSNYARALRVELLIPARIIAKCKGGQRASSFTRSRDNARFSKRRALPLQETWSAMAFIAEYFRHSKQWRSVFNNKAVSIYSHNMLMPPPIQARQREVSLVNSGKLLTLAAPSCRRCLCAMLSIA